MEQLLAILQVLPNQIEGQFLDAGRLREHQQIGKVGDQF